MKKIIFSIIFIASFQTLSADFWLPSEIRRYFSDNHLYYLEIYPAQIPDKYYEWKSAKPKKKSKFTAKDTTIIQCCAKLYKVSENDTTQVWERNLVNRFAPVDAVVSNDGQYVVTFDNWYHVGYGADVMVVYNHNGDLRKMYSLQDISPFPVNDYLRSVSSIHWRQDAKFLSNEELEISFVDKDGYIKRRIYNLLEEMFNQE
jgi:hypothetical protein